MTEPTELDENTLDELLLSARSDEYGDSGNYNTVKLKRLIRELINKSYISRKAVEQALENEPIKDTYNEHSIEIAEYRNMVRADIKKRLLEE